VKVHAASKPTGGASSGFECIIYGCHQRHQRGYGNATGVNYSNEYCFPPSALTRFTQEGGLSTEDFITIAEYQTDWALDSTEVRSCHQRRLLLKGKRRHIFDLL
jgi:hypothetical protein